MELRATKWYYFKYLTLAYEMLPYYAYDWMSNSKKEDLVRGKVDWLVTVFEFNTHIRRVLLFNLAGNQAPRRCLLTPPHPEGWGGESERNVKLKGWDKSNLIGKAIAMHASKAKQGINSCLPMGRQVFRHLQESRAPSCVTVAWEDKCHNDRCPPFLLLPPVYILRMTSHGMEYPFG